MLIVHNEKLPVANFSGTILDIETIGSFQRQYRDDDSRQYCQIMPTIIGYITEDALVIYCAEELGDFRVLREMAVQFVNSCVRPLFAFQSKFERGVLFHAYGLELEIDGELNNWTFEKKGNACMELCIPDYDDPFHNDGGLCVMAWHNKTHAQAIRHNRSCLLKERDILLKRGYRQPDPLNLIDIF